MVFSHRLLYCVVLCSHLSQGGNGEAYKGVAPTRPKAIAPAGRRLNIVPVFCLDVIEIEDGEKDEGGKACIESAVIEHESAVHLRR